MLFSQNELREVERLIKPHSAVAMVSFPEHVTAHIIKSHIYQNNQPLHPCRKYMRLHHAETTMASYAMILSFANVIIQIE